MSKIGALLSNINSTQQTKRALEKAQTKRFELETLVTGLQMQLAEAQLNDDNKKSELLSLYKSISEKVDNDDLVVDALAAHFKLQKPSTKKTKKKETNLDSSSEELLQFVGFHTNGISMKDLFDKFGGDNKVRFATQVKNLVENNLLRKEGEKRATKYFLNN